MEDSRRDVLLKAGVDIESAMERFMGNEELLMRFLRKFPKDENCETLKTAMAEERYDDAFKAAHTLKGLCGNLSLITLYEVVSREVEFLRGGNYEDAEKTLPEVIKEYDSVMEVLKTI